MSMPALPLYLPAPTDDGAAIPTVRKRTPESREWHRIHAKKQVRRELKGRRRRAARRRRVGEKPSGFERGRVTATCPSVLALEENFDEVVALISEIRGMSRRRRNERTYVDFRQIREVKPSGALVLAAELDRWNRLPGNRSKFKRADVEEWDPNVRRLLGEMGFFDLLGVSVSDLGQSASEGARYVKFRSGVTVDGKEFDDLRRDDLKPFIDVPNETLLFAAVSEAMTNVVHHAYEGTRGTQDALRRWWLSAAFDAAHGELAILIYDQGLGIPNTVPKNFGDRVLGLFGDADAQLIQAAHNLDRSATGEAHRGFGLQRDVRRYIRDFDGSGTYRVISGKGEYTVQAGKGGIESTRTFRRSLEGTFIEWRLQVNGNAV